MLLARVRRATFAYLKEIESNYERYNIGIYISHEKEKIDNVTVTKEREKTEKRRKK